MMQRRNIHLEAIKESYNTIGLAGFAGLSMMTGSVLPLLAGVVIEAAYLLFVPDSAWYRSRVQARETEDAKRLRDAERARTLQNLREEVRVRFENLITIRVEIEQAVVASGNQTYYSSLGNNLDQLQDKFLLFATKEGQFSAYLKGLQETAIRDRRPEAVDGSRNNVRRVPQHDPYYGYDSEDARLFSDWVRTAMADVSGSYAKLCEDLVERIKSPETDDDTRAVLQKRLEVLEQRQDNLKKIGRILLNLRSQVELLEETFGLINDQIRARSPEQVLADIESVVDQTDSTTRLLDDIAPLEMMVARLGT